MRTVYALLFLFASFECSAQVFDVDTLFWTGPAENRINLVILGDGYQESELEQFSQDANNFATALFLESPYEEYRSYFNVISIKVPSNESGASHPGTATDVNEPAHPVIEVDNYFGSEFDSYGIHRLLVATKSGAIFNVLADNFPLYDQSIILVNSPYYGGSGGLYPTASLDSESNEIAIHELGHSFVQLSDEYYPGDVFAGESANMTQETDPETVKWVNWMGDNGIGIYQHCCGGESASWYRPHQSCKMRFLGDSFCSVCVEGTIEEIHDLIDPIDAHTPDSSAAVDLSAPVQFSIHTVDPDPNTLLIEWSLNGTVIGTAVDSILLSPEDLIETVNQLQVTVEDTTTLLRVESHDALHVSTILWEIGEDSPSNIGRIASSAVKVDLFPNPFVETLQVAVQSEHLQQYELNISDLSGKTVFHESPIVADDEATINVADLPAGVYIVSLNFENGVRISREIIKR